MSLQIVKLGGGLLADKSKDKEVDMSVLIGLCDQIQRAGKKMIVVHGLGSFGHPLAEKYKLNLGFVDISQYKGVIETRESAQELNDIIVSTMNNSGIKAIPVITSSVIKSENGRIDQFDMELIEMSLEKGYVPVLFGDVVFDSATGFSILSADQILCYLSKELDPERSIFVMDEDGFYTDDPKENPEAEIISSINFPDLSSFMSNAKKTGDSTGAMFGKLNEIKNVGSGVFIIGNGKRKEWLYKAVMGQEIIGTVIN